MHVLFYVCSPVKIIRAGSNQWRGMALNGGDKTDGTGLDTDLIRLSLESQKQRKLTVFSSLRSVIIYLLVYVTITYDETYRLKGNKIVLL